MVNCPCSDKSFFSNASLIVSLVKVVGFTTKLSGPNTSGPKPSSEVKPCHNSSSEMRAFPSVSKFLKHSRMGNLICPVTGFSGAGSGSLAIFEGPWTGPWVNSEVDSFTNLRNNVVEGLQTASNTVESVVVNISQKVVDSILLLNSIFKFNF